jgi:ABC-2 type transport system permease protein
MRELQRFWGRVFAMAGKEALHVIRDPRTLWLALGMPVLLIVLFGYGVSFDVDHMPVAIVDQDRTATSRAVVESILASDELRAVATPESPEAAERLLQSGDAWAALVVPRGFADAVARREAAQLQLLVDGADASLANQVLTKTDVLVRGAGPGLFGLQLTPPLSAVVSNRFNPTGGSAPFIVPGLTAYVLALVSVLLTALSVAREWERGSMEQLFATPVGRLEIIVGKLLPYLGLGVLQTSLVLAAGAVLFDVPMRGLALVFTAAFLFLVGMLGQGLLISVVTRSQMLATQIGTFSTLLPSLLLSGFLFPIANLPTPLRVLSAVIPGRWFVALLRGALLRGAGFAELWPSFVGLTIFAVAMIALSTARFQRRLA